MAYECQNFINGQVLTAECLNRIDEALEAICKKEIMSITLNDEDELVFTFCDESEMKVKIEGAGSEGGSSDVEIPDALPNPEPLTINGTSYDGTEAVEITIPVGYTKDETDAIMGAYITDIDTLIGGDA